MVVTLENIVLDTIHLVVIAPHAPLDTIVQASISKQINIPVPPASIMMARVLPRHPRAWTVDLGRSVKLGLQNAP